MTTAAKYVALERLGRGPTCDVFIGRDVGGLNRRVAMKQLREEARVIGSRRESFFAAAERWSQLRHSGLVTLYDLDRAGGAVIYDPHPQTAQSMIAGGAISPQRATELLAQAAEALAYLHDQRLLHLNLKPSNVLFDGENRLKLIDGLCQDRDRIGELPAPSGSQKYLAPEMIDPKLGAIGPGTDIYSLGFVFVEMLLGPRFDELFRGVGLDAADAERNWVRWHAAADEPMPPIREQLPEISTTLEHVLCRMLNKNPLQRYHTVGELLDDLRTTNGHTPHEVLATLTRPAAAPIAAPLRSAPPRHSADGEQQPKLEDIPNRPDAPIVIRFFGCEAEMIGVNKDSFTLGDGADCEFALPPELAGNGTIVFRFSRGADGWRLSGPGGQQFYVNQQIVSRSVNLRSGDIIRMSPGGGGMQFTILNQNSESLAKLAARYAPRLAQPQADAAPHRPATASAPTAPRSQNGSPASRFAPPAPPAPPRAAPAKRAAPEPPARRSQERSPAIAKPASGASASQRFSKLLDYKHWDKSTKNWLALVIGLVTLAIFIWQWPAGEEAGETPAPAQAVSTIDADAAPGNDDSASRTAGPESTEPPSPEPPDAAQ